MPNTPQVNFNFYNNNVQDSTPLLGVSYVLARTTKGQFNDPSELIKSYPQFQRVFGEEIVPDGSVSNIKKALELGSILRVSRVAGAGTVSKGVAKGATFTAEPTKFKSTDWTGTDNKPADDTSILSYSFNPVGQVALSFSCNLSRNVPSATLNVGSGESMVFTYIGRVNGQQTWTTGYSNHKFSASSTVDVDIKYANLTANAEVTVKAASSENSILAIKLTDPNSNSNWITVNLNIGTKEAGSAIVDNIGYNLNRDFYLYTTNSGGPTNKVYFTQITGFDSLGKVPTENILDNTLAFSYSKSGSSNIFIEASVFQAYINNAPNLEFTLATVEGGGDFSSVKDTIKDMNNVIGLLRTYSGYQATITLNGVDLSLSTTYCKINEGQNGGDADEDTWYEAYKATEAYNDGYQLICSNLSQYTQEDGIDPVNVYSKIAADVISKFELVLYVEVPKYNEEGDIRTVSETRTWLQTNQPIIGNSKSIAYFGGGIKYYDEYGFLQNCDTLGSVIGLGDASASNYGPWYSFSGMNRGVITSAQGPVMENLGGPGKVEELQSLAEWYCNLFVVKDTRTMGKQTMLWHGFTSNPKNDSEKFLSIVRLNLYIKKTLRPILESYLEEPNTFSTWKSIYYEGKEVMDDLVNRNAMTEYTWLGDQDATSYEELQINNEADVRQGKYHLVIKYKDIVPLQEVTVDVVIDAASQSVNVETSSESI